jgi:hypothetical protein
MSANRSKDRSCLCAFTFADGRRCSAPRLAGHLHLCCFHAKREAHSLAAEQVGRELSSFLSGSYLSAGDLSSAFGCVFSAVVQGQVKPKTATTLAYLGQALLQSIQVAQHEYINAFGTDSWRQTVRSSFAPPPALPPSTPQPAPPPHPSSASQ